MHCAAVLERMSHGWKLDTRQSTRRALKHRRGEGEILIINHNGRGWWDPLSQAKGDVFDLVQHLDPSLNFGQVCQILRGLLGKAPSCPGVLREERSRTVTQPIAERWSRRPRLRRGSAAWRYLTDQRALTAAVIEHAAGQDAIREGHHGSAWFAHRDAGQVSHVEVRGPDYKGSLRGGRKTLFRYSPTLVRRTPACYRRSANRRAQPRRSGGMPAPHALRRYRRRHGSGHDRSVAGDYRRPRRMIRMPSLPAPLTRMSPVTATPEYHAEFADAARVRFERLRPPDNLDWNDVLKKGRGR